MKKVIYWIAKKHSLNSQFGIFYIEWWNYCHYSLNCSILFIVVLEIYYIVDMVRGSPEVEATLVAAAESCKVKCCNRNCAQYSQQGHNQSYRDGPGGGAPAAPATMRNNDAHHHRLDNGKKGQHQHQHQRHHGRHHHHRCHGHRFRSRNASELSENVDHDENNVEHEHVHGRKNCCHHRLQGHPGDNKDCQDFDCAKTQNQQCLLPGQFFFFF